MVNVSPHLTRCKHTNVSTFVRDYSDAQMYIAMADENAGDAESPAAQVDVVSTARKMLIENPEWCKVQLSHRGTDEGRGGNHPHEHGSVNCLLAFLGEENWSLTTIKRLLNLSEKADASLLCASVRQPRPTAGWGWGSKSNEDILIPKLAGVATTPASANNRLRIKYASSSRCCHGY